MARYHKPATLSMAHWTGEMRLIAAFWHQTLRDATTGQGKVKAEAAAFLQNHEILAAWAEVLGLPPARLVRCVQEYLSHQTT
jgi:hypothetical protein